MNLLSGLATATQDFAALTCDLADSDLERAWSWQDYDEGVRFAFFRTYEDLRTLASRLAAGRIASVEAPGEAQIILAQFHTAFRDLQAVLLGRTAAQLEQSPGGEEWPVREALKHIISAERNFYFMVHFALEDARQAASQPTEMTEAIWVEFWSDDPYAGLRETGSALDLMSYYSGLHQRILDEFCLISAAELQAPAVFWESQPYPIHFRLHRFDSHLRQHTIQIEKTLSAVGLPPNEAHRLLRLVFNALAEVEGYLLGSSSGVGDCEALAGQLRARNAEIARVLGV
jgi:hypothetical protein